MPISLLLADDSDTVRTAIKRILQTEPEIELVGEAEAFPQTLALCSALKPNVVLLDLHMPGPAFEAHYVKSSLLSCAKLVLAMCAWDDDESRALATKYGAVTLLDKAQLASKLIPAIKAAA
jgi:DNA-binding NarL/FixJ family response regulator